MVQLIIGVDSCTQGTGLEVAVFAADSCRNFVLQAGCMSILNGSSDTFTIDGLVYDSTYYLMIDGIDSATCGYQIAIEEGIGTIPPIYSGSGGGIDGPTSVCLFTEATYTLTFPDCEIIDPGDGCPIPSGGLPDTSLQLEWHIPDGMEFLTDSINVTEITVSVTDTTGGWIYVTFGNSSPDTLETDIYCDTGGCAFSGAIFVDVYYNIDYLPPILLCDGECIDFCDETYCESTTVWCPDSCGYKVQEIIVEPYEFEYYFYSKWSGRMCIYSGMWHDLLYARYL